MAGRPILGVISSRNTVVSQAYHKAYHTSVTIVENKQKIKAVRRLAKKKKRRYPISGRSVFLLREIKERFNLKIRDKP